HKVEALGPVEPPGIADDVLDPLGAAFFRLLGEADHPFGQVDADDLGSAAMAQLARVVTLAAGQVQHGNSLEIAAQAEQGVAFDVVTPRLLLGAAVIGGDRVVVRSHGTSTGEIYDWRTSVAY